MAPTGDRDPAHWSRSGDAALWLGAGSIAGPMGLAWIPFLLPGPLQAIAWPLFAAILALAALAGIAAIAIGARAKAASPGTSHRWWVAGVLGLVGLGLSISIGVGMLWGLSNLSNLQNLSNLRNL